MPCTVPCEREYAISGWELLLPARGPWEENYSKKKKHRHMKLRYYSAQPASSPFPQNKNGERGNESEEMQRQVQLGPPESDHEGLELKKRQSGVEFCSAPPPLLTCLHLSGSGALANFNFHT